MSAPLDAIIVPTGRPAVLLGSAIRMAKHHRCPLVLLCSMRSSARKAAAMAKAAGVEVIAVDMPPRALPKFATAELLRGTRFEQQADTSSKRNLGLLLAWMSGWERIAFLDDDIEIPRPGDLASAAGALGAVGAVGLNIDGYPDNSVVCHAFRLAGGAQDTFIGGGALVAGAESFGSFFPDIYNEDWFFLLGEHGLRPCAISSGRAVQRPYDPFRDTARARTEELGDTLAEGVFTLLDELRPLSDATAAFWRNFLVRRRRFIDEVIDLTMAAPFPAAERARMVESLKAARGRSRVIDPQLCADFITAWQADRAAWQKLIHGTRRGMPLQKALAELGLMHAYQYKAANAPSQR